MDRLTSMTVFKRAVDDGSFAAAATAFWHFAGDGGRPRALT